MNTAANQNCRFGILKDETGALGGTMGGGAGLRLGVVAAMFGRLWICAGAPTKPARWVNESRGLGVAAVVEGADQVDHGNTGAARTSAPTAG